MPYEIFVWELSDSADPILVVRKKFVKFFDACDFQEEMEEKGYECHWANNDVIKK